MHCQCHPVLGFLMTLSLWSSRRTSCWFFEKSWVRREQAAREIPPSPPPRSDNEPLSIEQGRAVLYRDFVTILWGASMEYITKLVTLQSQEHRFPPLPEFIMYDAIVWCVSCLIGQSPIPKAWLRIRIHFIRTRIQHFRLNTDQDAIRIRGFDDQKLKKIYCWKKNFF